MLLSDFCMEPIQNTMLVLPVGTTQNITSYYLTCTGVNPTQEYIDSSYAAITSMNDTLNTILASNSCPLATSELIYVQQNLTVSYNILNDITALSSCPPIQSELSSFLENTTCYQIFVGMYIVWVCQYVISGATFFVLITASIIYHYFGRYWNMEQQDLDLITNDLEVGLVRSDHNPPSLYGVQSASPGTTQVNNKYVSSNAINYDAPAYTESVVAEEIAVNPMQKLDYNEAVNADNNRAEEQVTNPMQEQQQPAAQEPEQQEQQDSTNNQAGSVGDNDDADMQHNNAVSVPTASNAEVSLHEYSTESAALKDQE